MKYEDRQISKFLIPMVFLFFGMLTINHAQTTEQLAEKALAATVYLEMQDSIGETLGIGSGFFVQPDLIATNYHVIEGTASGTAKLVGKYTKYTIEGVTTVDKDNDLVLLKVSTYGIKPLPLGDSDRVSIGTQVYAAGNPKGLEGTFSDGIISSKRGGSKTARLQMTAPISPESSGGPVLNRRGEVIGVAFMFIEGGQNLNFAIPSNYLKTLLDLSGPVSPVSRVRPTISAETYFMRGYMKYESGDYWGAIAAFDSAIRLKPDYADAYSSRGVAKVGLGKYVEAIADRDGVLLNGMTGRGILGKYVEAIADCDSAIRLKPDFAEAYNNRGGAKSELGRHFEAIEDYNSAIRLKPDYAEAYYNRGLAKALLGKDVEAKQDMRAALRIAEKIGDVELKSRIEKALRLLE